MLCQNAKISLILVYSISSRFLWYSSVVAWAITALIDGLSSFQYNDPQLLMVDNWLSKIRCKHQFIAKLIWQYHVNLMTNLNEERSLIGILLHVATPHSLRLKMIVDKRSISEWRLASINHDNEKYLLPSGVDDWDNLKELVKKITSNLKIL